MNEETPLKNSLDALNDRIELKTKMISAMVGFLDSLPPIPENMEKSYRDGLEMILRSNRNFIEKETAELEKDIQAYKDFSNGVMKYLEK